MKFKDAYKYAMNHSEAFKAFDARVKRCEDCGYMVFSCKPGEAFYYGYDGAAMRRGQFSCKKSVAIMDRAEFFLIA